MNIKELEIIKKIISEQLDISTSDISENLDLFKDLGADSFDIANMVSEIEIEFKISIPYIETKHITSVKELLEYTEKKLK